MLMNYWKYPEITLITIIFKLLSSNTYFIINSSSFGQIQLIFNQFNQSSVVPCLKVGNTEIPKLSLAS